MDHGDGRGSHIKVPHRHRHLRRQRIIGHAVFHRACDNGAVQVHPGLGFRQFPVIAAEYRRCQGVIFRHGSAGLGQNNLKAARPHRSCPPGAQQSQLIHLALAVGGGGIGIADRVRNRNGLSARKAAGQHHIHAAVGFVHLIPIGLCRYPADIAVGQRNRQLILRTVKGQLIGGGHLGAAIGAYLGIHRGLIHLIVRKGAGHQKTYEKQKKNRFFHLSHSIN